MLTIKIVYMASKSLESPLSLLSQHWGYTGMHWPPYPGFSSEFWESKSQVPVLVQQERYQLSRVLSPCISCLENVGTRRPGLWGAVWHPGELKGSNTSWVFLRAYIWQTQDGDGFQTEFLKTKQNLPPRILQLLTLETEKGDGGVSNFYSQAAQSGTVNLFRSHHVWL